jgi:hypothetical protein
VVGLDHRLELVAQVAAGEVVAVGADGEGRAVGEDEDRPDLRRPAALDGRAELGDPLRVDGVAPRAGDLPDLGDAVGADREGDPAAQSDLPITSSMISSAPAPIR